MKRISVIGCSGSGKTWMARRIAHRLGRTLRRVVTREELWNGNREPWSNLVSLRAERNIIVWAWTRFRRTRRKYEAMLSNGTWDHLKVHRIRTRVDRVHLLRHLVPRQATFAALTTSSDAAGCVLVLDARPSAPSSEVLARDAPASPSTSPTLHDRALARG